MPRPYKKTLDENMTQPVRAATTFIAARGTVSTLPVRGTDPRYKIFRIDSNSRLVWIYFHVFHNLLDLTTRILGSPKGMSYILPGGLSEISRWSERSADQQITLVQRRPPATFGQALGGPTVAQRPQLWNLPQALAQAHLPSQLLARCGSVQFACRGLSRCPRRP